MKEIEWVKDAVAVCIAKEIPEQEKQRRLEQLAQQYQAFAAEGKAQINHLIKTQFHARDGIYLYSFFLRFMRGNQDFAEGMLDLALEADLDALAGSMLELQERMYEEEFRCLYHKRRALHKKNVERFNETLQISYPYIRPEHRNKKRIVIVTEQLIGSLHAPTAVVLNFAYILKKMGYEIRIFICPGDLQVPEDLWYEPVGMHSIPTFRNLPFRLSYREETLEGYQINMTQQAMKEYHMMLTIIHAWNPYFVLDLGTVNPVVDLTAKFTTLVAFEMSIDCPVSEGAIFVRTGRAEERLEKMYAQALEDGQKQFFTTEKLPLLVNGAQGKYKRADLGLAEGRFLTAIVGNRLNEDVSDEFQSLMRAMLRSLPEMDFVIIGEAQKLKERFAEEASAHRIYFLGYQQELMEVYQLLDLYLNPDRAGGGFSGAMALLADLPVVTLPDCDVSCMTGDAFVVADYGQMLGTVQRYVKDPDFYKQKQAAVQQSKVKNSDQKLEQYTCNMLDQVLELMGEAKMGEQRRKTSDHCI